MLGVSQNQGGRNTVWKKKRYLLLFINGDVLDKLYILVDNYNCECSPLPMCDF